MSKLIIGFDSWTGGLRHFERLIPEIEKKGFKFKLFHIEDWAPNNKTARPNYPPKNFFEIENVSSLVGSNLIKYIFDHKPSAILLLSTNTLTHRAIIRIAKFKNIPTLNLYHGILSVLPNNPGSSEKVNLLGRGKFIFDRVPRMFFKVIPTYFYSLRTTKAKKKVYLKVLQDLYKMALGIRTVSPASDTNCTYKAVYTESDKMHAIKKYNSSDQNTFVVGNPDLFNFGFKKEDFMSLSKKNSGENNHIIYIDSGMPLSGRVFASYKEYIDHIELTKIKLEDQNYKLLLKLKPNTMNSTLVDLMLKRNFEIIEDNKSVTQIIKKASAVITEDSTFALVPGLIGIPLFLANYGKLKDILYGEALTSYPRSRKLKSLSNINQKISDLWQNSNHENLMSWGFKNSGPLPSDDMPYRVAEILEKMVKKL